MTFVYLLLTLVLLSIMVIIHELGHFLFAKLFGVTVLEFSVGMGPAIFTTGRKKRKKGKKSEKSKGSLPYEFSESFTREDAALKASEQYTDKYTQVSTADESETEKDGAPRGDGKTVFSVRAFPVGGYVSMAGEDTASDDVNAFCNKKVWQRLIITLAGPVMNLLLGFLCVCLLVGADGAHNSLPSNTISFEGVEESISDKCESPLMSGDTVIKVNGVRVHTGNELDYEITNRGYEPIDITVIRDGRRIQLEDVTFPVVEVQGVAMGQMDFHVYRDEVNASNIVKHAFYRSKSMVKMIVDSIIDLFRGRYGMDALSGPVGVSEVVGQATKNGFYSVLYLFGFITINLGVFNLIPFPALDGGRVIFLIYEGIFRRPVKKEVEQAINTVGLMLLLGLAAFVMVKDIFALF